MVEAKLLRKKLKNGLIVDKWDLVTIIEKQQAEIDDLKKFIAESNALDKKLHESMQKANEVWGKATKTILKKAQE